ncbi:hypothetical protein C7974DRAFT_434885 [Boeremia exigua]|uniref:uncharacterized protein n=1 Tax=Boeremia exigua TaxID=749465 RepID=UPI001E8CCB95|nr:uncharacterized protein C7974DRAFT_434885 [Boeremia exigua]KAH6625924.1 hypothetical protein C7974DRAFT_434885 [Boeremia exigua]
MATATTVFVTGANTGLGLNIVKALYRSEAVYHVLLGAQFDQQASQGNMTVRDMWNQSWNVNVTGTYILTGSLAPLLCKSAKPRLLFITSGTSTLAEHGNLALAINRSPEKGWPKQEFAVSAYRSAKTGMNMMFLEWVRILKEDGVKVFAVSPGMLATGLGGNPELMKKMGALDPNVGAELVRDVIDGRRDEDAGKVVRKDNIQLW